MARRENSEPGFFRGIIYGVLLSGVIYIGLVVAFPLAATAPSAEIDNPIQLAPQAFDVGPGNTDDSGIAISSGNDSAVNISAGSELNVGEAVAQPIVATESAAVPTVDDGATPVVVATNETDQPVSPEVITTAEPIEVATNDAAPSLPDAATGEAFDVFSVSFSGVPNMPMIAIVFEDTQESSLQPLFDANIPLNFAVLAANADPIVSQGFRQFGYEVLAKLPENMTVNGNLSQNVSAMIQNVPASIGVIDSHVGGVMRDGSATQVLIETAAVNGMGTIAFAGAGDINAKNLAAFYGKPFGSVHRIIDETSDIAAIKSALDRAALTAQTSNSAIVFARTRPTTVQALLEWLQSPRANQVQFVPISQIMRP